MGGPEKWQKRGRPIWVLSHFWCLNVNFYSVFVVPLSFYVCYGSFSLNSTLFIHSPCQTGSQPMSGWYYIINIVSYMYTDTMLCDLKYEYTIVHTVLHVYFLAPLSIIGITGFCLTLWFLIFRYYEYTYIYVLAYCLKTSNSPLYICLLLIQYTFACF